MAKNDTERPKIETKKQKKKGTTVKTLGALAAVGALAWQIFGTKSSK